jgi:hypothetical protein
MNLDTERRLEALSAFVIGYASAGKTRRQFWEEFAWLAGDLESIVWSENSDSDLRQRYCEITDQAVEAGFAAPEDRMDEVMGE